MKKKLKISRLKLFQVLTVVLAIGLLASVGIKTTGCATAGNLNSVAKTTIDYINTNLLPSGVSANYVRGASSHGVYNITISINGKDMPIYVSGDGKLLFPAVIDMTKQRQQPQQTQQQKEVPKTDKPVVKLFVMSYCPYGTQMEKGIIPAIKALGDSVDFQVEFVSYSMHGEKEIKENMLQYCIQKDYKDKYLDYLECFLGSQNSTKCISDTGLDKAALDSCVTNVDNEYNITNMYNDKSTWLNGRFPMFPIHDADNQKYGVQGSPTLVINDVVVQSGRDSASLLNTICSAFTTQPEACNTNLSSTTPSPGFGYEGTGTDSGSCS